MTINLSESIIGLLAARVYTDARILEEQEKWAQWRRWRAMSLEKEPNSSCHKTNWQLERSSHAQRFRKLKMAMATSRFPLSRKSLKSSDAAWISFLSLAVFELTTLNLSDGQTVPILTSSTRGNSSQRSTKPTSQDTAPPAAAAALWSVKLHREVAKDVVDYGLDSPDFTPTLGELITSLELNPKRYPKKNGKLKDCRSADLKYKNVTFRAVFVIDETAHSVKVISLDPHDRAYDKAVQRLN